MKYMMIYCVYNPNGQYFGHRVKMFDAKNFENAEKQGLNWLEGLAGKGQWEYMITEYTSQSSYRVYDTLNHKRV